eukprot:3331666-Rhodomonas_salina.2
MSDQCCVAVQSMVQQARLQSLAYTFTPEENPLEDFDKGYKAQAYSYKEDPNPFDGFKGYGFSTQSHAKGDSPYPATKPEDLANVWEKLPDVYPYDERKEGLKVSSTPRPISPHSVPPPLPLVCCFRVLTRGHVQETFHTWQHYDWKDDPAKALKENQFRTPQARPKERQRDRKTERQREGARAQGGGREGLTQHHRRERGRAQSKQRSVLRTAEHTRTFLSCRQSTSPSQLLRDADRSRCCAQVNVYDDGSKDSAWQLGIASSTLRNQSLNYRVSARNVFDDGVCCVSFEFLAVRCPVLLWKTLVPHSNAMSGSDTCAATLGDKMSFAWRHWEDNSLDQVRLPTYILTPLTRLPMRCRTLTLLSRPGFLCVMSVLTLRPLRDLQH